MSYTEIKRVMTDATCTSCDERLDTDEHRDRIALSNQCFQCFSNQLPDAEYHKRFGSLMTYAWDDDADDTI